MGDYEALIRRFRSLPTPSDYYKGRGEAGSETPQNILFFFRSRFDGSGLGLSNNFHYRHVLILNKGPLLRLAVDGALLELGRDSFLLLLPYQYHRFLNDGQGRLCLLFMTFEMEENLRLLPLRNRICPSPDSLPDLLGQALDSFLREESRELPHWAALMLLRLSGSGRREPGPFPEKIPGKPGLVSTLCRLIYEDRKVTVRDLSGKTGYSEGYLRSRFKQRMGVSLGRYILESRLSEAMKYLNATDKSISEIAELTGYDSIYSLSRSFRSHLGISPSVYRRRGLPKGDPPGERE